MELNSTQTLIEKLQLKTEENRAQIERLTKSELMNLAESLKWQSIDALSITVDAIKLDLNNELSRALTDIQNKISTKTRPMLQELDGIIERSLRLNRLNTTIDNLSEQLTQKIEEPTQNLEKTLKTANEKIARQRAGLTKAMENQSQTLQEALTKQTKTMLWLFKIPLLTTVIFCILTIAMTWIFCHMQISERDKSVTQANQRFLEMNYQFCKSPAGRTLEAKQYCKGI